MKIHEYQAKRIFASAGIPIPREETASSAPEAVAAAQRLGLPVMLKAQVLVGGRGKAGAVVKAATIADVERHATRMLTSGVPYKRATLVVRKVLLAEVVDYLPPERYVAIVMDRAIQKPTLLTCRTGGMDIETIAREDPDSVTRYPLEPAAGPSPSQLLQAGLDLLDGNAELARQFADVAQKLYSVFVARDCSLVEINPLVIRRDETLVALDAKIVFDDAALPRQADNKNLRDEDDEHPLERRAREKSLFYVKLVGEKPEEKGDIGCIVNGTGLAMATMDITDLAGGRPANFLDVGGSSSPEKMADAVRIVAADSDVKVILVNVFGGITRCDDVAQGLIRAVKEGGVHVPVVARLTGTNAQEGRALLAGNGVQLAETMEDAVRMAANLAGGRR